MENKKIVLSIDDNVTKLKLFQGISPPKYDLRLVKSASNAINFLEEKWVL